MVKSGAFFKFLALGAVLKRAKSNNNITVKIVTKRAGYFTLCICIDGYSIESALMPGIPGMSFVLIDCIVT
jgi:hypothetical protein